MRLHSSHSYKTLFTIYLEFLETHYVLSNAPSDFRDWNHESI